MRQSACPHYTRRRGRVQGWRNQRERVERCGQPHGKRGLRSHFAGLPQKNAPPLLTVRPQGGGGWWIVHIRHNIVAFFVWAKQQGATHKPLILQKTKMKVQRLRVNFRFADMVSTQEAPALRWLYRHIGSQGPDAASWGGWAAQEAQVRRRLVGRTPRYGASCLVSREQ